MSIDRRDFLKGALGSGALLASSATVEARENNPMPSEAVGLLFDSTLCVGCKACVAACKEVNGMPPEFSTQDQLWDTPIDLSGKTLNVIKFYKQGTGETRNSETDGFAFMKNSCMHCADPSCVSACPAKAMTKDPVTGVVSYNKDACIGCRYCVAACPFGVPRFEYDKAIPQISKCQLCRHRMKDGKYAACAEVCPTGATLFGKVKDLKVEAKRRLALKPGEETSFPRGNLTTRDQVPHTAPAATYVQHLYGDKEVGGTQVLKLSAVPFEKLGMPTLPERSYAATSETLQHTLYSGMALPIAFLGVLSFLAKRTTKDNDGDDHTAPDDKKQGGSDV
ncbi:hydrogenase 2 operon protein HybA [Noviherbaspirillum autotrophicum]|uniref:Hydrogenase 2 protein HybA n=1 Tax=Noviherbaspirillum autotrophicum TaxID=709839 RepID=A0A0C2BII7_9BURK|nr:hydrogenase 2 operon protein HybA [Noviherbaspirillum autotrophicum]KIF81040.1 hydrogenase 2 protein HybA [Noviherbaspirillum autotrophicum]